MARRQGPWNGGVQCLWQSRRGDICKPLNWSANDKCWYGEDQKQVVLKDQIWPTIVSEIIRLGDTCQRPIFDAIKTRYVHISQKDIVEACRLWKKYHLSLLGPGNDTLRNSDSLLSMLEPQRTETPATEGAGRRALVLSPPSTQLPLPQNLVKSPKPSRTRVNTPQPQCRTPQNLCPSHLDAADSSFSPKGSAGATKSCQTHRNTDSCAKESTDDGRTTVKINLAGMLEQLREEEVEAQTAADEAAITEGEAIAAEGEAVTAVENAKAAIEQAKTMALEARQEAIEVKEQVVKEKREAVEAKEQALEISERFQ